MTDASEPTRRDFIASSALGLMSLAGIATRRPPRREAQSIYVGCYTDASHAEGLHLVSLDTTSGALSAVSSIDAGPNPSFLALHPNGSALYAVNEIATGRVTAFAITPSSGDLTSLGAQSSTGAGPCYVSVDRRGRVALIANYDAGSVALLPIQATGALGAATSVDQHRGKGPNAERQEAAHAHCIVADPSNRYALSADLGVDRVFVYALDLDAGALRHIGDGVLRPGAGPRHIAFHPTLPLVFVVNELDSTVTSFRFDRAAGTLTSLDTQSTLPAGWRGTSWAADIHLSSLGNALYVSNRGHNSIAVFSVGATGTLALTQTVPTEGDWPRNFTLDATERWLLVANQHSGSIVVLARDPKNGRLTSTRQRLEVPSPACVRVAVA